MGAAFSWNLFELPLGSRRPPEVVQSTDDLEHRHQSHPAGVFAQACMRSKTIVNVGIKVSGDVDFVRIRKDCGVTICLHLNG